MNIIVDALLIALISLAANKFIDRLWPEKPDRGGYFIWRDGRFVRDRRIP